VTLASSSGNSWDSFVKAFLAGDPVPSPLLLQRKPRVQELPEEEAIVTLHNKPLLPSGASYSPASFCLSCSS